MVGKMFFKKKKPHIRFYSVEPGVADVFPIIPAAKHKRDWMKKDYPTDLENGDMHAKNCPGIKMITSAGFILTAPADFIIKTDKDNKTMFHWSEATRFKSGSDNVYVGFHTVDQTSPTIDDPNKSLSVAVKLDTPWRVEASDDIVLLQIPVTYNNESRFTAAHGILDPKYGYYLNVQLYWHVLEGETLIKAGTPLVQYIPIKRDMLNLLNYDVVVDTATTDDLKLDETFSYVMKSSFIQHDNLKSRLQRTAKIMNNYNIRRRKSVWISLTNLLWPFRK